MNWGFIGFGRIAIKFLESLEKAEGQVPYAIASRSNYQALSEAYPEIKLYDTYEALLADPEVDIIYVSTTNNLHKDNTIASLKAGKHVLCEKPMGLGTTEIQEMISVAKKENRFLMEGLWSRFLPGYQKAKEVVLSGEIGDIKLIRSEFAFTDVSHKDRLYDPLLAGGSNYDVNIYNLALVLDIMGNTQPEMVVRASKTEQGTDLSCATTLSYPDSRMAQIFSSIELSCDNAAYLYGTEGWVRMEHFWMCEQFEVKTNDGIRSIEAPFISTGFYHEILAVAESISSGHLEHPLMTHKHSLELTELVERTEQLIRSNP